MLGAAAGAVRYHLVDKWQFVYFEFTLANPLPIVPRPEGLACRLATSADRTRIVADVFPDLVGAFAYDRRYFDAIDADPDLTCYLAESDGKIVHYSWVRRDASRSPLPVLPFGPTRPGDAYIGPVFTSPKARGLVYPFVLGEVLRDLKAAGSLRLLLMVDGRRPAALGFYRRLGFALTGPAPRRHPLDVLRRSGVRPE